MESLLLLLFVPLAWPFVAKMIWPHEITWKEMGANVVIVFIVVSALYGISRFASTADVEIWNGEVTGKEKNRVSCSHAYPCNCRSVSCGKDCSTVVCDICYLHTHDFDWDVYTNVGSFSIARLDLQGVNEPPRWTSVKNGQPVARAYSFTNYIKAAPNSLFYAKAEELKQKFSSLIPTYPSKVYDYHYNDRVLAMGVNVPDLKLWNQELPLVLREIGPKKQANIIILFVNTADENYYEALKAAWLGGKKNDIVVIFGTPEYPKIEWVKVMSWTDKELFKVQLQDELFALKTIDRVKVLSVVQKHTVTTFVRKRMRDFKYLMDDYQPPVWALVVIGMLGIFGSVGLSYWFYKEDF